MVLVGDWVKINDNRIGKILHIRDNTILTILTYDDEYIQLEKTKVVCTPRPRYDTSFILPKKNFEESSLYAKNTLELYNLIIECSVIGNKLNAKNDESLIELDDDDSINYQKIHNKLVKSIVETMTQHVSIQPNLKVCIVTDSPSNEEEVLISLLDEVMKAYKLSNNKLVSTIPIHIRLLLLRYLLNHGAGAADTIPPYADCGAVLPQIIKGFRGINRDMVFRLFLRYGMNYHDIRWNLDCMQFNPEYGFELDDRTRLHTVLSEYIKFPDCKICLTNLSAYHLRCCFVEESENTLCIDCYSQLENGCPFCRSHPRGEIMLPQIIEREREIFRP